MAAYGIPGKAYPKGFPTSSAKVMVAASDSNSKQKADYICDGVNDEVEINAAIASIGTVGGVVVLLEGTYYLGARVYVASTIKNLWLIGYGAKLISPSSGVVNSVLRFHPNNDNENINIIGLDIDGNANSIGGIGFASNGGSIRDCYIHNVANGDGILLDNLAARINQNIDIINNRVVGTLTTMTYGIHIDGSVNATSGHKIIGNTVQDTKFNGIAVYGANTDVIVSQNTVRATGHSGIATAPSSYTIITDNIVTDVTYADEGGIEVEYNVSHHTSTSHHVVVSNNIVRNCNWGIVVHNRTDDLTKIPYGISVVSNNISVCTTGIYLHSGSNVFVACNILESNTTDVTVDAGASYGMIDYDGTTNTMGILGVNLGVGTSSPNANAILDVTSTTKAFMPPRMTTTQRDAIASPAEGMVIHNTTTHVLNFYNGTTWGAV